MFSSTRRRIVASIGAAAALSLALASCASTPPAEDGPVTLTFQALPIDDATTAVFESVVDSWNADNPDVQVELRFGDWDSVNDQLVTQFVGGTAPDIIHNETASMVSFAGQGYLADLDFSEEVSAALSEGTLGTVTTADGLVFAAPFLLQSYVAFANVDAFEAAGVPLPDGDDLAWSDFQEVAQQLTGDGKYGVCWGLKQPTAPIVTMAPQFGGEFFSSADADAEITIGDGELAIPELIHEMAYTDQSIDPVSLTLNVVEPVTSFVNGECAIFVSGNFMGAGIGSSAPEGFDWTILPPFSGTEGTAQVGNPQTLSVSASSEHIEQATAFIDYWMGASNLAELAQTTWLLPPTQEALDQVAANTEGQPGWAGALRSGENFVGAPLLFVDGYQQWKDQIAQPAFQQYLANAISLDELEKQLVDGWASVR